MYTPTQAHPYNVILSNTDALGTKIIVLTYFRGRICGSQIEIEYYFGAYFKCTTKFDAQ